MDAAAGAVAAEEHKPTTQDVLLSVVPVGQDITQMDPQGLLQRAPLALVSITAVLVVLVVREADPEVEHITTLLPDIPILSGVQAVVVVEVVRQE